MNLSDTEPKYPALVGETTDFTKMTGLERDTALLDLISLLSTINEYQDMELDDLEDRIKTLELGSTV